MAERLVIHPLGRGIRPMKVELHIEGGRITAAKVGTTYFWDFSGTLQGKDPLDALQLTQRNSGLDFVAHAVAAARALEEMAQVQLSDSTYLSRNILLALDMIYGHLTHFYQNVLPDYIPYPANGPFNPGFGDFRLPTGVRDLMIKNMWRAFDIRQNIHRTIAVLAGKAPHLCSVVFGGTTRHVNITDLIRIDSYLKELTSFVNNEYTNDVGQIEKTYAQYYSIGAGSGSLLSVGEFPWKKPTNYMFNSGTSFSSSMLDKKLISIDCTRSWFDSDGGAEVNLASSLKPAPDKAASYSWTRGAVYNNKPCEVGALARMTVTGNSAVNGMGQRAISVLGRYRARLEESKILAAEISNWLEAMNPLDNTRGGLELPDEGAAIGTAEASNGAVVHYIAVKNGKIDTYNILDSYSWNLCPITRAGQNGPLEQALLGLNVPGRDITPDILRVARSF